MKHLYFQHSNGEYTLIGKNVGLWSDDYIWAWIFSDLRRRNPEFVVHDSCDYYGIDGKRRFEVGSKTEQYVIF